MAKASGLGWTTLSVDDASGTPQDIRNDITQLDFSTPRAVQDITGLDRFANERLLLLADFSINLQGVFNSAANKSHAVFSTVPSTSVNRTTTIVVNSATLPNETLYTDYPLTRDSGGALTWKVPGALADGTVPTWS